MIYYGKGLHEQKAFKENCKIVRSYENTMNVKNRVLSLPISPYIQKEQVEEVVDRILSVFR